MRHFGCVLVIAMLLSAMAVEAQTTASGIVYLDSNGNAVRDGGENGLSGVLVSNGSDVAETNAEGRWQLPCSDDMIFFVIQPTGYRVSRDAYNRPKFYYIHKPAGSPPETVSGVAGTGPLPSSIDFPLLAALTAPKFTAVICTDPQARGITEVNYVKNDIIPELIGIDAAFGITLGDIVADDPGLMGAVSECEGQAGVPWYHVFGNHDHNRGAKEDRFCDETFEMYFGPSTYAFDVGGARFIVLRDYSFAPEGKDRFPDAAVQFVRNLLERTPKEKLVVLLMHVPYSVVENTKDILGPLSAFPHAFSIAGHTHTQYHTFCGAESGWTGPKPHHQYVVGAVSGSWWCGERDETSIPHATMNDGTPNGYAFLDVDGTAFKVRWKCARRPANYQMNIYMPDTVVQKAAASTEVLVNFFMGSAQDRVEMRVDAGEKWTVLTPTVGLDPECMRMSTMNQYRQDGVWGWNMDFPNPSDHFYRETLGGEELSPGMHTLTVRARDIFGQEHTARRVFRVVAEIWPGEK